MRAKLLSALFMSLSGIVVPAEGASQNRTSEEPGAPQVQPDYGRELVCTCHDMWFLLSSVSDKKTADSAAAQFRLLIDRTMELSEQVYSLELEEEEGLADMNELLVASLEELTEEFDCLCKMRCYGSESLISVFRYAIDIGLFTDDYVTLLDEPPPHLTESETKAELVRLKHLEEPDMAVLLALRSVQDAQSAANVAAHLQVITARLHELAPAESTQNRDFSPSAGKRARKAYAPLEPLLWGIRVEIVRIAALPGYHKKDFDSFSVALENVFRILADTHYHYFDEVFDESFHLDLDEALRENATTSN